jgi:N-acetylglucosaminyldiphosphoundecaprenol N-acetyl-beta-D-mannosaminyltransferase
MIRLDRSIETAIPDGSLAAPCSSCYDYFDSVEVNSLPLNVLDLDTFCQAITRFRSCSKSHVAYFLSVHPTVVARQVPSYGRLLASADLRSPDGAPLAALMRRSTRSARRVTSTDGFLAVCQRGVGEELRHFLVGGANEFVSTQLTQNLRTKFPGISIVGVEVPPFRPYTELELTDLASRIIESRADVVWIGIGAPKQEVLAYRLRALNSAAAIVTIGATFDFVAETKARAPQLVQRMGLEWLYRLGREPVRLWRRYLIGNSLFIYYVLMDGIQDRRLLRNTAGEPKAKVRDSETERGSP